MRVGCSPSWAAGVVVFASLALLGLVCALSLSGDDSVTVGPSSLPHRMRGLAVPSAPVAHAAAAASSTSSGSRAGPTDMFMLQFASRPVSPKGSAAAAMAAHHSGSSSSSSSSSSNNGGTKAYGWWVVCGVSFNVAMVCFAFWMRDRSRRKARLNEGVAWPVMDDSGDETDGSTSNSSLSDGGGGKVSPSLRSLSINGSNPSQPLMSSISNAPSRFVDQQVDDDADDTLASSGGRLTNFSLSDTPTNDEARVCDAVPSAAGRGAYGTFVKL